MLHGTTTNQITNLDGLIYRAARQVLLDVDPQETIRITQFTNPIYTNVYDYALPSDLKGNKVIDIRPQVNRLSRDVYNQDYSQQFDLAKQNLYNGQNQFNINFNTSVKTIRIDAPFLTPPTLVNQAESITGNGTWAVDGVGATSLTVDNVNFVSGAGSLKFNLAAGQVTGYIQNSTFSAVDLSTLVNQGTLFVYVYLPTASSVTSVNLRWGSSSSNYYSQSATTNQQGNAFVNGWNLLAFAWNGSTTTGTPVSTAINYLRVTYTYDGTLQTGVHLNNVTASLGSILELVYYSKFLFRDGSSGAYQETVTADSNLVNLDTESYNLLFSQVAYLCAQQQQGLDAAFFDSNFWLQQYNENLARYQAMYKSQVQKPRMIYYKKPNPSFSKYWNRWQF